MEINNGWIRWEEIGENMDVELKSIQYNKNGNPYAVCNTLADGEPIIVKFNISKTDAGLKQGRYNVKAISVNNGFGYVEFKPLQDSSWDTHDELENKPETRFKPVTNTEKGVQTISKEDLLKTLALTRLYRDEIPYNNYKIQESINNIKRELYLQLGELVVNEQENK